MADFGATCFFAGRIEARFGEVIAQAEGAVLGDLGKRLTQFLVGKLPAFFEEFGEVFENALGSLDVFGISVYGNVLAAGVDAHVQQRLQVLNVLVVNTEQRFQSPGRKLNLIQEHSLSFLGEL